MKAEYPLLMVLVGLLGHAPAAQTLESNYRTAGPAVHQAFSSVQESLQSSSAVVKRGRSEVIFATVISTDGFLLTKASELGDVDDLSVIVDRDTYDHVELVGEDPEWDVALLKIDATGLVPVSYSMQQDIMQGTWVVANGATTRSNRRVQVGVVSANAREVYPKGGMVLGVSLKTGEGEALVVEEITEDSGAEEAGIEVGDQIVSIEGEPVESREDLLEALKERRVGDVARLGVERDGKVVELDVKLSGRVALFGEEKTRNDAMSGEYSSRRSGFPRVMQHDIMGNLHFMGGPVFDLNGECVGMNIARFSRCETYAIPSRELEQLSARLVEEAGR